MQNLEELTDKLTQLPEDKQREVADYVDFLISRLPKSLNANRILRETSGIWKDEMNGIAYENALRRQWKERS
ncbi:MAG: DUF2281 domain-containing protein [Acidobacteriota bacterium]